MPTKFDNIAYLDDKSIGEVRTLSTWYVWDCIAKSWSNVPPVVLRNVLLCGLHPNTEFCIGEIQKTETNPATLAPFKPPEQEAYYLDLASGSRTHGRFTFSIAPVGKLYCGSTEKDQWKRIIYGSILHTDCKRLVYKQINFIVTDDEHRDANGNPMDDPTNKYHWYTGDSHAKASRQLMELLGLPAVEDNTVNPEKPLQFRAASFRKWIGKGTVAYNPALDGSGYDLAIPLSSLKGKKPGLGNFTAKLLLGLVFEAEQRRAKPGWMLFQWFDFETLEKDNIISKMIAKCSRLRTAYNSIVDLAEILRIDQTEAEAEIAEGTGDSIQSEAEYENTMIRLVQADKNGVLLLHPYVVRRVKERMKALWLNLAKAAGVRFYSLMAQPDESLAHYHTVLPDGRIEGDRVFCAPDFDEGEYIVFCNPMRHWGDVQLWQNKHEGDYINATGIIAAPRLLLLDLGRDTDGDFIQLIRSSAYPNMRAAIAKFSQSPIVQKFPKMALSGTLQEIAVRSMNDLTGVVASLLARARSAGAEQIVLEIPPGGQQKQILEMKIIDFLSQELQIAVDSLKSAYPNNVNGLDAVKKFLDKQGANSPWLKDFKDPACYRDRACAVNNDAKDTISRIVQTVNSYWKAPDLKVDSSPRVYENVLFNDVPYAPEQLEYALAQRDRYRADMRAAIAWKEENDDDTRMIREVAEATKASKTTILETPNTNGALYDPKSWVAVYWRVAHQAETGDAGLVFMIFADEIVNELKRMEKAESKVIACYAVQHGSWSVREDKAWRGQEVDIRAYMRELNGKQNLALEMKWDAAKKQIGWFHLGLVGEAYLPYIPPGTTKRMKIYATRFKQGVSTEVKLFDLKISSEEINDYLNFRIG